MQSFAYANPATVQEAVALLSAKWGEADVLAGGTDLLSLMKEHLHTPKRVVNIKNIKELEGISKTDAGLRIGALVTMDELARNADVKAAAKSLADAAAAIPSPQIRHMGTVGGDLCQRPRCWYYRQGFGLLAVKDGKSLVPVGANQFHAIFGGGPSFIVHPSDTAPALVALDAKFRMVGPKGERTVPAADFFVLPKQNAARENALADDEVLASIDLPAARPGTRGTYHKVLDREAWTHAVVSAAVVLDMDKDVCRSARVVLGGVAPIPWRVPAAERLLTGQRITPELAAKAAETALAGATPLAKNAYKVPLTREIVQRTVLSLATTRA